MLTLPSLQPVCTGWEDLVWAGAKCAVDLMVETEIRETMVKSFAEMPPDYWNTPQSLNKVGRSLFEFHIKVGQTMDKLSVM